MKNARKQPIASRAERGYGAQHRRLRRQWARLVAAGGVLCARCGREILPGTPWDLDHADDRAGYLGASHVRCNRATAGRKGAPVRTNARRRANWW